MDRRIGERRPGYARRLPPQADPLPDRMSWPAAVSGAVTQTSAFRDRRTHPRQLTTDRVKTLIPAAGPDQVSDSPGSAGAALVSPCAVGYIAADRRGALRPWRPRRGGRVVNRTALEMRNTGNRIGGSNPSLSASPEQNCERRQ
jgi:hypothetical protein